MNDLNLEEIAKNNPLVDLKQAAATTKIIEELREAGGYSKPEYRVVNPVGSLSQPVEPIFALRMG